MKRRQLIRGGLTGAAWWAAQAVTTGCSSGDEHTATQRSAVPEPTNMIRSNWSKDPWALGSYSFLPVGASPQMRRALAEPIDDRLFFAGEATDSSDPGTVHGARASGHRVAGEVAVAARPGESVLIVGAGMAGLSAAARLSESRGPQPPPKVTVLEARDRTGGRIHSVAFDGTDSLAELGASWVHAAQTHDLDDAVRASGAAAVPFDYDQAVLGPEGTRLPGGYLDEAAEALDQAVRWAQSQSTDLSLSSALTQSGAADQVDPGALEHYLTTEIVDEYGAPTTQLSARWAFEEGNDGDDLLVTGGYQRVVDQLVDRSSQVALELGVPVAEIARSADRVTVTTVDGQAFTADRVIVTVPLGVLKAGDLKFSPPLPDAHRVAIEGLGMGLLDKVILRFEEPFWDEPTPMWTRVAPGEPFREWFNLHPTLADAQLMALTGGDVARAWADRSDERIRRVALDALDQFMDGGW